jgi:CRP-like cAMP-binding protein
MATSPAAPSILQFPDQAEAAERLLRASDTLSSLSEDEARCVVSYMRLMRFEQGQVLLHEGDKRNPGYMVLILDGDVTVETTVVSRTNAVVMSVVGPGHLVGEIGLLDGGPRAASCIAATPVVGAGLSRRSLHRMLTDEPDVAAKLLLRVSERMAERMRESSRQQRIYCQLVRAMQGEIDALEQQLQHVMAGAASRFPRESEQG